MPKLFKIENEEIKNLILDKKIQYLKFLKSKDTNGDDIIIVKVPTFIDRTCSKIYNKRFMYITTPMILREQENMEIYKELISPDTNELFRILLKTNSKNKITDPYINKKGCLIIPKLFINRNMNFRTKLERIEFFFINDYLCFITTRSKKYNSVPLLKWKNGLRTRSIFKLIEKIHKEGKQIKYFSFLKYLKDKNIIIFKGYDL